jgi:hypothetical protein
VKLPLFRPLRYRDYPFVQAVPSPRGPVRRDVLAARVKPGRVALMRDFDGLRSDTFEPACVHPMLRRFYATAERHHLTVEWLRWERWALPLSAVYVPLARRLGNLCVPARIDRGARMSSSVQALSLADGGDSRRWVRTFTGTASTFYVAALRTWVDENGTATYWSMTFPQPGLNLLVLRRVANDGDGIVVSSRGGGAAGTYLIIERPGAGRSFVALPGPPTVEELHFRVADNSIIGLHEDFIGKRRAFALQYRIDMPAVDDHAMRLVP